MTKKPYPALLVPAAVLAATLALTGCGRTAASIAEPSPTTSPPAGSGVSADTASDAPVLRVEDVGGLTTASASLARVPAVSVYADGRVITEAGPVVTSSTGAPPALPVPVVRDVGADGVAELVRLARDAGVGTDALLGRPGIADATTTRFTVQIDGAEATTEAYALRESVGSTEQAGASSPDAGFAPGDGLTPAQDVERRRLIGLRKALTDVAATLGDAAGPAAPYRPSALAVLAVPLIPGTADGQPVPWPGPALPGEPTGASEATCVVAQGAALGRALVAAGDVDVTRPWSWGGSSWALTFRPLLPDERGCADLGG